MCDEDRNNWRLPAFHEKWAPLGEQIPGIPHPSEASGCGTRTERELEAQLGTLQLMVNARIQQMGNEALELGQHVQTLISAKDAKIAQLQRVNEEYHFICNMATEGGKQMEFEISDLVRKNETLRRWTDRFRESSNHYQALLRLAFERKAPRLSKYRLSRRCRLHRRSK